MNYLFSNLAMVIKQLKYDDETFLYFVFDLYLFNKKIFIIKKKITKTLTNI